jgi:tRNA 5-methylaminomethyl-2-thiouridine biosynthesis bifunctional protein
MRFTDNANIEWSHVEWGHVEWKQGQPYASAFQDVYFSSDNGLLETEYVFVQGNNLSNRWQQAPTKTFTIAETGFGTGLNFLCAARTWLDTAPKDAVLHFISVEKYPLNLPDITSALLLWPELLELAEPFLASYETLLIGTAPVMLFDNRVQLTLLVGDATACLKSLNLTHSCPPIDAWFLDGFAPAKNPDMWQVELFEQMARLSTQASTFATFTSASTVRRGLLAAGFEVTKQSGFGKKREMLLGRFTGNANAA